MNVVYIVVGVIIFLWLCGGIYRHLRGKNKILRAIENNCTGCKRCLKMCRHKALDVINDENGVHITVDPDKCTSCGDCIGVCKFNALELVNRI
jgi:NAD-dependent dihydropyrimidine dehydrogenase PreA subunit